MLKPPPGLFTRPVLRDVLLALGATLLICGLLVVWMLLPLRVLLVLLALWCVVAIFLMCFMTIRGRRMMRQWDSEDAARRCTKKGPYASE